MSGIRAVTVITRKILPGGKLQGAASHCCFLDAILECRLTSETPLLLQIVGTADKVQTGFRKVKGWLYVCLSLGVFLSRCRHLQLAV